MDPELQTMHDLLTTPFIDFDEASAIDKGSFRTSKVLKFWHTLGTPNRGNNSRPLPAQYNILFMGLFISLQFLYNYFPFFLSNFDSLSPVEHYTSRQSGVLFHDSILCADNSSDTEKESLFQEIQLCNSLEGERHPNIVNFLGYVSTSSKNILLIS